MTDATKILIMAATILITCIIIALGMNIANNTKKLGENAVLKISELDKDISESSIMAFHGMAVTGSEITNFIKEQLGEYESPAQAPIYIYVKTSTNTTGFTHRNNLRIADIRNFASATYYIKPTGKFMGSVTRNENGIIVGVNFTQE